MVDLERDRGNVDTPADDIIVTDLDIQRLLDDSRIAANETAASNVRATLSKEEFHRLRALCKRNLYYLCYSVLGYKRLSVHLHGNLCTHVNSTEYERFHEYLLPRGHFKSTILTIAHPIQIALPYTEEDAYYDPIKDSLPWPNRLGSDVRILIGHETAESAARFLFAITSHFTSNPTLMALFPDAIPSKRIHRINKWELELPRTVLAQGNPEPTFDTLGVGGKSQGRHYNYIILDDIFGDKARDSPAEAQTTIQWFDNIQSFFSTFKDDHLDLIGTRYSHDDVYAHAEEVYGKRLIKYSRKVVEPKIQQDSKGNKIKVDVPIFPEEFSIEDLEIIKKNKKVYNAQYLNDPDDGTSGFDADWKRFFYWLGHNDIAVFQRIDESLPKTIQQRIQTRVNVRDLDICFLIDPGLGRSGGFAVTGMDYNGRVFVLVAIRFELRPDAFTDFVFKQAIRWQPRCVAIESDFFASTFQHWWTTEMTVRGIRFHVEPVHTKKIAKDDRILGLSQYMSAEKFYINEKQEELLNEWKRVGKSRDVHIFDAIAYGPEVWRPGFAPGQREIIQEAQSDIDENAIDPITGYSLIEYG